MENHVVFANERKILSLAKLIKLAGNSIVVPVLESIFEQMFEVRDLLSIKDDSLLTLN